MVYKTTSASQTKKIGYELGQKLKAGGLVLLTGDLGAGKTTFIQGLAKGIGVRQRVNSPTFIIARRYKLDDNFFFHIDLYRLTSSEEVENIGISEMWQKGNVVCIEWPELVEKSAPKAVKVKFTNADENHRQIEIIH